MEIGDRKVIFVRVGWMQFYNGSVPGDERPIGGGSHNKSELGHELYNFRVTGGRLYGYFQPPSQSGVVALERIDRAATQDVKKVSNVLVIFVARRAGGGQVIVGWYKDADVFRTVVRHSPGKPRGYGHFCSALQFSSKGKKNCVLLPSEKRLFKIQRRGGLGQANVCYFLDKKGKAKNETWMYEAIQFVDSYAGSDILTEPQADAEIEATAAVEAALARSKGQGFARTAGERKAIEAHSMAIAKRHFRRAGYDVVDVSSTHPYDFRCKKGRNEIHVEVKGTTTDGASIVLTKNEVRHALDEEAACVLFIVHSITLSGKKASGGKIVILDPWEPDEQRLTAICYTYRVLQEA